MNRRLFPIVAGWLVVGLIATGAGVVVTAFLGESITRSTAGALSPADVRRALEASPAPSSVTESIPSESGSATASPSPSPAATRSERPAGTGRRKAISTRGGVVVAGCTDGLATLYSWTPAQGYEVKDAERGPRDKVRVRFERGDVRSEIEIRCSEGHPVPSIKID
ncbi:hypothetical protein GCM10022226_35430 [Sphaerisporangium flaviroseum]|uniref:Septum formation initiator n=1 Tax=Sphaerisporangium flaviroseum TaxID=509199 RepID=A0ABP7I7X0_9ACTN